MEQLELELEFSNSKLGDPGGTPCALSPAPIMEAHKDSVNQNDATWESTFWANSSNSTGLTMKSLHREAVECVPCVRVSALSLKATSRGPHLFVTNKSLLSLEEQPGVKTERGLKYLLAALNE